MPEYLDSLRLRLQRRTMHDYRRTFETPHGRRVLADLARSAGADRELLVPGDAMQTAHALGRRRMLLRIASFLTMTEADLIRLAKQQENDSD